MPGWEEGDWRDESLCQFKESNLLNAMGLEFYDLSHPWGHGQPCWPYFKDVKIERLHGISRSGVLTQEITTVMHSGTHIDAPAHVVPGTPFMDEVPLPYFFGTGVIVSIPKKKWEVITAADLEAARPKIRPGDIVGALTGQDGITGQQVGKIYVADNWSYVAVNRALLKVAFKKLSEGKLKGRKFRVMVVRG